MQTITLCVTLVVTVTMATAITVAITNADTVAGRDGSTRVVVVVVMLHCLDGGVRVTLD